jgi:hypothetical protein
VLERLYASTADDVVSARQHQNVSLLLPTVYAVVVVLNLHLLLGLAVTLALIGYGRPHLESAAVVKQVIAGLLERATQTQPGPESRKVLPIGGVQVFEDELSVEEEDAGVHAAEVFVVEGEVVGLAPAEAEEAAAVLESNGEVAGAAGYHVGDCEGQHLRLQVHPAHFQQEAAHLH